MRKRYAILIVVGLACLAPAAPGGAAGLAPSVADCYAHGGQLTRSYSAGELRTGLATMPADIREYSPCYDTLQRALLNLVHGLKGGGSAGGGGSFLPVWLIILLALLVAGAAGLGIVALRNRGGAP